MCPQRCHNVVRDLDSLRSIRCSPSNIFKLNKIVDSTSNLVIRLVCRSRHWKSSPRYRARHCWRRFSFWCYRCLDRLFFEFTFLTLSYLEISVDLFVQMQNNERVCCCVPRYVRNGIRSLRISLESCPRSLLRKISDISNRLHFSPLHAHDCKKNVSAMIFFLDDSCLWNFPIVRQSFFPFQETRTPNSISASPDELQLMIWIIVQSSKLSFSLWALFWDDHPLIIRKSKIRRWC